MSGDAMDGDAMDGDAMGRAPGAARSLEAWAGALRGRSGAAYWRGLEELLATPEFRAAAEREFPALAHTAPGTMSRRRFVRLLGASLALAGVGGCLERPREKILPYHDQPPEATPGRPRYYATAMELGGFATGLLVESHVGRPTKVEGNPLHPASLGAAGVYEQASVLQLYDPDRARHVTRRGRRAAFGELVAALAPERLAREVGARGAGLHLVLEPTGSPLVRELVDAVRARWPEAGIHVYAPLDHRALYAGTRLAFGRALQPRYDLAAADVVVALDADLLGAMPFHLRHARDFAARRRPTGTDAAMNRLYVAEATPTVTGALADHRLRVAAGRIASVARALVDAIRGVDGDAEPWVRAAAADLLAARGRGLVVVGERQPPEVQALAHLANHLLGNVGRTVSFIEPTLLEPAGTSDLTPLAAALRDGSVRTLLVLEANPAYTAPADLEFARALERVPTVVQLGLHRNETSRAAHWFVPARHYLERWGDAVAYDGTPSIVQPLIAPMYDTHQPEELLAALAGEPPQAAFDRLRERWAARLAAEGGWDEVLRRGVAGPAAAPVAVGAPDAGVLERRGVSAAPAGLEVVFAQDPSVYDGRFANVAWLQELPDPITKLTWDNAALVSPATASRLGVETGDLVAIGVGGRTLRTPVFVLPGQADDAITLPLGYGRVSADEHVARGAGVNAYALRTGAAPYVATGATVARAGGRYELATTQTHWSMEGRPIVLSTTLDALRRGETERVPSRRERTLSLHEPWRYTEGDQWAMAIDLSLCSGCSACVVACQAENNVPVVGKEGVLDSREMHWLRIDRYYTGDAADPGIVTQPMLCQHCERAPCEYVCPVNATVHSPDGLNEMVYNRCVGTRFCSNNCPYKVRRYNWFDYAPEPGTPPTLAQNPDVTVRARGVIEKCTFCVQRLRAAQIARKLGQEDTESAADEVQTACQQACPTRAIVFGSLTAPDSEVARLHRDPRAYAALGELGTEPRVRYLARVRNPSPALEPPGTPQPEGGA